MNSLGIERILSISILFKLPMVDSFKLVSGDDHLKLHALTQLLIEQG